MRELAHVLQCASLLAGGGTIGIEHLADDIGSSEAGQAPDGEDLQFSGPVVALRDLEEHYLRWAVAAFPGDRRAVAGRLGLSERTLYRKLSAARRRQTTQASGSGSQTSASAPIACSSGGRRFEPSRHSQFLFLTCVRALWPAAA